MYKKIFCPIDGSETAERGADVAMRLAADQKAQLCFFYVVDNGPLVMYGPLIEEVFESARQRGHETLGIAAAKARALDVDADTRLLEIVSGRVGPLIVEEAERYGADIIVMGTHGRRGVGRLLLGSDAAGVVGSCKAPLLLVK